MSRIALFLCSYFFALNLTGQIELTGLWSDIPENSIKDIEQERWIVPQKYRTIQLNTLGLDVVLDAAESTSGTEGNDQNITIPMPDGSQQRFAISEWNVLNPRLAAKFPEIKTYRGKGIDDPTASIYIDLTPKGFHGMIMTAFGTVFVDPYYKNNSGFYITYYKQNYKSTEDIPWSCEVQRDKEELTGDDTGIQDQILQPSSSRMASITKRTYRIAVAANSFYTAFHGGTVAGAMAAITTTINRVSGIYESELGISLELVANNDLIIFDDPNTDPYPNDDSAININQQELDSRIGNASYDVGHIFTTTFGGVAGLGVICTMNGKADGTTGLPNPMGDPFYIDFVAHEIGHQFGGDHTFNGDSGSCSGANRNGSTAYEPGSGSTIQAYAGICGDDNLQNNSDPYFHLVSLIEMRDHVTMGSGASCGTLGAENMMPLANANAENIDGKSIPENTPFELTGSATDPDGDNLTYNWEQWDLGPQSDLNNPTGNAPLFRSFAPTTNATRIFPKIADILSNNTSAEEQLPTGNRTMNFQFIARDDNLVGAYGSDLISLDVVDGTGPFKINTPNIAGTFSGVTTVSWDVAGTDTNPINCGQVDIYLSTDGGQTFGTQLVNNTTNNGSANVILPEINVSTARLKVKCADNVFFDINDADFTIEQAGINTCSISNISAGTTSACDPDNNTYSQDLIIAYIDAPETGNLMVNGQQFPIGTSPQTVTLVGLNADGNAVTVTAEFSDNFLCTSTQSIVFTSPPACAAEVCETFNSTDTPMAIPENGTPTITSTIAVNLDGVIENLQVKNLNGTHTWIRDLDITLKSPAGTIVTLFSRICNDDDDFNINFADSGSPNSSLPCPPIGGGTYQAVSPLSIFNDETATGDWTLTVADAFNSDGGSLDGWTLEFCMYNEIVDEGIDCNTATNEVLNNDPITPDDYHSGGTITSAGRVAPNTTVNFTAATSITLTTDFHAEGTSNFSAKIMDCNPPALQTETIATYQQINENAGKNIDLGTANNPTHTQVTVYPNPFQDATLIAYELGQATEVTIRLFDLSGKEVQRILTNANKEFGAHQIQLEATNLAAGMYLLNFQTKETVISKRLVIQR